MTLNGDGEGEAYYETFKVGKDSPAATSLDNFDFSVKLSDMKLTVDKFNKGPKKAGTCLSFVNDQQK